MAIKGRREDLDWNVDMEVQLFYAMRGHKPVGVNRHFQMACVHEKFKNMIQKDVSSQLIWDHLETMYDMAALHESEIVPFPNDETDFVLPDTEYSNLLKRDEKQKGREEDRLSRSRDSLTDEKETPTPSGKQISRDRSKEARETDAADNTPKRKRMTRQNQQDQPQKPSSPAGTSPFVKRRRT